MSPLLALPAVDGVEITTIDSGALFEPIIPQTVQALQQINPAAVVPAHCTGWRATQRIAQMMPDAFTPNSVGTTFVFMG